MTPGPIPESYWVADRLAAGEYPRTLDEAESIDKIARFHQAGITSFIDLTEEGELLPYDTLLSPGVGTTRMPIRDTDCPTHADMRAILDAIDAELDHGKTVYVHCWGGAGRTGTVVGCWLVRHHGITGEDALARIEQLRRTPDAVDGPSPSTATQFRMVREWRETHTPRE